MQSSLTEMITDALRAGFTELDAKFTEMEQALAAEIEHRKALAAQLATVQQEVAQLKAAQESTQKGSQQGLQGSAAPPVNEVDQRSTRLVIRGMPATATANAATTHAALLTALSSLSGNAPHITAARSACIEFASPRVGLVLAQCSTTADRNAILQAAHALKGSTGWSVREDLPITIRQQRQTHNGTHQALREAGLQPQWRGGSLFYLNKWGVVMQYEYDTDTVETVLTANAAGASFGPQGSIKGPAPPTKPSTPPAHDLSTTATSCNECMR
jgi:hypothetical protein